MHRVWQHTWQLLRTRPWIVPALRFWVAMTIFSALIHDSLDWAFLSHPAPPGWLFVLVWIGLAGSLWGIEILWRRLVRTFAPPAVHPTSWRLLILVFILLTLGFSVWSLLPPGWRFFGVLLIELFGEPLILLTLAYESHPITASLWQTWHHHWHRAGFWWCLTAGGTLSADLLLGVGTTLTVLWFPWWLPAWWLGDILWTVGTIAWVQALYERFADTAGPLTASAAPR